MLGGWRGLLTALAPVIAAVVVHSLLDIHALPETAVLVGPIVAALVTPARVVAAVAVAAIAAVAVMGVDEGAWGTQDLSLRLLVVGICGLAVTLLAADRDARRQAQAQSEEMAELARRLDLALQAGGMGAWVHSAASGRTVWDERLAAMHGFELAEYDGRFETWIERVHPEDRHLVLNASDDAIAHRTPYAVAYRVLLPSGEIRWLEARGDPIADGTTVTGTAGVVVDITDRMTVANALEESRSEARAVLHERDALGATLQTSLLPTLPPRLGDLGVEHAYRPGSRHLLVGGDFFDAVALDGTVRFVIGDVSGHDATSAAVGVALRAAWRAAALTTDSPVEWTNVLHHVLLSETNDIECFATLSTGLVRGDHVSLAVAGHPPPLIVDRNGVSVAAAPADAPVGLGGRGRCTVLELERPWTLVLYTDGLIEGRASPGAEDRYGIERVVCWLDGRTRPGAMTAGDIDALLAEIEMANGERLEDDVALLVFGAG